MRLSTQSKLLLLSAIFALFFQACGSSPANENRPQYVVAESKSEFPFSTVEPEVYQGEVVVGDGGTVEHKWFVARSGARRRFDIYKDGELWLGELQADRNFTVNHLKKIYAEKLSDGKSLSNVALLNEVTANLFTGKEFRGFEDLGREGNLRKFKVRKDALTKDDIVIFFDEALGMIVRQEFIGDDGNGRKAIKSIFEIRNLLLEADESLFSVPSGYKKVTWSEFKLLINQN